MTIKIAGAPCCWGVDDPKNPYLPPWELVLEEASQAGYKGIELGPYGYIPMNIKQVKEELAKQDLTIIAGTIFDNLVDKENVENLLHQVDDICSLITQLPQVPQVQGQHFKTPYLVIIDWGHDERDYSAGHSAKAERLSEEGWAGMMKNIRTLSEYARDKYGVRPVIHPHAGGYIEFEDEITKLMQDIPYKTAGLCLDTGHLYYSKMDPYVWIKNCADRLDYVHFKDINLDIYKEVMNKEIRFFDACKKGVMCPIGQGIINYSSIHELLKEIDYHGYITIEQERDPRNYSTSLRDIKQSVDYLTSVGY